MSKTNKKSQNYRETPNICGNCKHYSCEKIEYETEWNPGRIYVEEKKKRCGLGGLAVKKSATCDRHEINLSA